MNAKLAMALFLLLLQMVARGQCAEDNSPQEACNPPCPQLWNVPQEWLVHSATIDELISDPLVPPNEPNNARYCCYITFLKAAREGGELWSYNAPAHRLYAAVPIVEERGYAIVKD